MGNTCSTSLTNDAVKKTSIDPKKYSHFNWVQLTDSAAGFDYADKNGNYKRGAYRFGPTGAFDLSTPDNFIDRDNVSSLAWTPRGPQGDKAAIMYTDPSSGEQSIRIIASSNYDWYLEIANRHILDSLLYTTAKVTFDYQVVWTVDNLILFSAEVEGNGKYYLYEYNLNGKLRVVKGQPEGSKIRPAVSNDGKKIAFMMQTDTGGYNIWNGDLALDPSGFYKIQNAKAITSGGNGKGGRDDSPAFCPDHSILFTRFSNDPAEIFRIGPDGGDPQDITYAGVTNEMNPYCGYTVP